MKNEDLHVIILTPWYPHEEDPMLGLFVKRQCLAISNFSRVSVIAVIKRRGLRFGRYVQQNDALTEVIITLPVVHNNLFAFFRVCYEYFWAFRYIRKRIRKIDVIHANIFTKTVFIGWLLSMLFRKPLIISEHWSRFLPENFSLRGRMEMILIRFLARHAYRLIVPSGRLMKALQQIGVHAHFTIFPNVIDSEVFHLTSVQQERDKTIVHVSCFEDKSKDLRGFIDAIELLAKKRRDFRVLMIGEGEDRQMIQLYIEQKALQDVVRLPGLMLDNDLAHILASSAFLVLSSRYETFAIVVFEALACGIPVVVTDVADLRQWITKDYGIVVPPERPVDLSEAMNTMLDTYHTYDRQKLRQLVQENMKPQIIGKKLFDIYNHASKCTCFGR